MKKRAFVYAVFRVQGVNRERLLNLLRRRGISLYRVKNAGEKAVEFAIPAAQEENFFAITANLCYTITKKGERGVFAPLARLWKKTGVLLGAALFAAAVCVADGAVLAVDYYGSGAVYKDRAEAVLTELGIAPFTFAKQSALDRAQREILRREKAFSFASVKKRGARLKVELVLAKEAAGVVDTEKKQLVTPVSGVVESITVLRGTALVRAGDAVAAGDVLAAGYNEIKDTVYETYVLASASVLTEQVFEYVGGEGKEEAAVAFAEAAAPYEIVGAETEKAPAGEKFVYTVKLTMRLKIQ